MADITTTTTTTNAQTPGTPVHGKNAGDNDGVELLSPQTAKKTQERKQPRAKVKQIATVDVKRYYEEHNDETFEDRFQGNEDAIAIYLQKNGTELKIKQWLTLNRKQPPHVETEEEKKQKEKVEQMLNDVVADTSVMTCLRNVCNLDWHNTTFNCPALPDATFQSPFAVMSEDFNPLSEEEKLQF
jgi:hypothetical protein